MSGSVLDALSRRAAVVMDRKTSLAILGAAALTSATVSPSRAKKKHGKKGKRGAPAGSTSPPPENKCAAQRPQCLAFVKDSICHREMETRRALAIDPETDEECVARLAPCCDYFAGCQLAAGMLCLATPAPRPQLPE